MLPVSCIKTGEGITQGVISDAADISAVTLRTRYRELTKKLGLN